MSVDEELARAVEEAEAVPAVAQPAAATPSDAGRKGSRNLGLLLALLVMMGGILTLVFTSFQGSAIYKVDVDQLMQEPAKYAARNMRVQGMLVKGSLMRRADPCEFRFKVEKNGHELNVYYPLCVVPDTFRDMPGMDVEVTAEGKLGEGGVFQASTIMAKCPSKYEMKTQAASGVTAPHAGPASPLTAFSDKE